MNIRPRLHYHTDCDFFAGCENMIANFLNDDRIRRNYKVSFSYRKSVRYETGLRKRVNGDMPSETYPILASDAIIMLAANMPKLIRTGVKGVSYLLLVRYWLFAWNTLVLFRAWRHHEIDLLHINNGNYPGALSSQAAAIAARLAGINQVVMVINNIAIPKRYWRWPLDFFLDYWIARSVSIFVTGSMGAGRALQAELKLPNDKIVTLHNGIAARQANEMTIQTRIRLGVEKDVLLIGMVALLEWRKGHSVLLNAIAKLRKLVPLEKMPIFLIEGEGEYRLNLDKLVKQLAIEKWVRFIGVERNIFDFMQALDVLVLPSIAHEDFPNVILEAMSLGKPVIASRLAGTPEQIEDGVTGWLVEPGDPLALALKIATFIEDRTRISAMGAQSQLRFKAKFTAEVAVSRYMDLYQEVLSRNENSK